jgi:CheY-like chemotaxis protein
MTRFRVLVVDDNHDVADSLAQLLRLWGYEVRAVYDASEAMKVLETYQPDCIFSDIEMPGLDGYRFAEQLRQSDCLRGITLVAVTSYADEARSRAAGFDYHLTKPADPLVVAQLVKELHAMGKHLERTGAVVTEARELMKEVKDQVQGVAQGVEVVKEELREVKEDVKEIKEELRDLKEEK